MKAIICLDDNNGMLFNNRRQSQDKILREHIKSLTKNNKLYMNNYSYKLFNDIDEGNVIVSADFLDKCEVNEFALIEDKSPQEYLDKIDELIVYRWNTVYPSDLSFNVNLNEGWSLISTDDFKGSSHENITVEIYKKNL